MSSTGDFDAPPPSRRHRADGDRHAARTAGPRVAAWQTCARDRLLLAFRVLNAHGIAAVGGFCDEPETARDAITVRLRQRNLAAAASYVFWTASADDAFDGDGSLRTALRLFTSGPAVVPAVLAALTQHGLCGVVGSDGTVGVLPVPAEEPSLN